MMLFRWAILLGMSCLAPTYSLAQEDCGTQIAAIKKVGELQTALTCLDKRITESNALSKKELTDRVNDLYVASHVIKTYGLKPPTKEWTIIAGGPDICFVSSKRLPDGAHCEVVSEDKQWLYYVSDSVTAEYRCNATCIWVELLSKQKKTE